MILSVINPGGGAAAPANINGASLLNSLVKDRAPTFTAPRSTPEPRNVPMNRRATDEEATNKERGRRGAVLCSESVFDMPVLCAESEEAAVAQATVAAPAGAGKLCIERRKTQWSLETKVTNVVVPCDPAPKKSYCSIL